MHNCVSAALSL